MRLLAFICMFTFGFATAQQLPLQNYNVKDGLIHSTVYSIYQDRQGFLWFCTDYGFCWFDGRSFRSVENDSLVYGGIISISETKDGTKLVSSIREGIILMSDSGLKQFPLSRDKQFKYILNAVPWKNDIWALTRAYSRSLVCIRNNRAIDFHIKDSTDHDIVFRRIVKCQDELLFTSNHGIYKTDDSLVQPFLQDLVKGNITDLTKASDGTYWVSLDNKVIGIKNNKIIYSYTFPGDRVASNLLCDRNNNVWITMRREGIFLLRNGIMEDISGQLAMPHTLINDLCEDTEGNIWIATYDAGVYKVSTLDLFHYTLGKDRLNLFCKSLDPYANGQIIIGSMGTIHSWKNGQISEVPFDLQPDEFTYFAKIDGHSLYVGTPKCLYIKDLASNSKEKKLTSEPVGIISMCEYHTGGKWFGGYQYLYYYDKGRISIDTSSPLIRNRRFSALYEDSKHNLWLGTSEGLLKYDGKKYTDFPIREWDRLRIIRDITEDSHSRIWVGTEGGLLCIEGNRYKVFSVENGLMHNRCNSLTEGNNNILWIGTLHGLNYIDLNTLNIKAYSPGIYPEEVLSLYFRKDNVLFVGTTTGLSSIKTDHVRVNDAPPPVYFTRVKTESTVINMPKEVRLAYDENNLRIDFIALSFQNIYSVEYRYKIRHLHDNWLFTTNNSLELQALPAGDYVFVLNARNNKGSWSKDVVLPIHISTPFWKAWWFVFLLVTSIVILIFFATRWYIRKNELKKREQLALSNKELSMHNKVAYLKQQAFGALINPHFIFNCMNSIQHYLNRNDNEKANSYLADFAHLIRITIEDAQQAFINLDDEIVRIRLYLSLEQLRFGDDLQYTIHIADELDPSALRIPNMILQPYIENAIWHGIMPNNARGNISINFARYSADYLRVTIEDNGIGIEQSRRRKSMTRNRQFGMALTKDRLLLLKQLSQQNYHVSVTELQSPEGKVKGTLVEIILPMHPVESVIEQAVE